MRTDKQVVALVLEYYQRAGRHDLPWRRAEPDGSFDAYKIMVSEMMLQQTQVNRVIPKYQSFLVKFPSVEALAAAQLSEVLAEWVGLGYNRRARYLHEAAKALAAQPQPWQYEDLVAQKGIGPNTAAAIVTYSYGASQPFVETNIRTVVIHHYFTQQDMVAERDLAKIVQRLHAAVTDTREWYWALMDYGTYLKATAGNAGRRGSAYVKQSVFEGSRRQLRGQIIRLLASGPAGYDGLQGQLNDSRFEQVVKALIDEKLIKLSHNTLMLYNGGEDTK